MSIPPKNYFFLRICYFLCFVFLLIFTNSCKTKKGVTHFSSDLDSLLFFDDSSFSDLLQVPIYKPSRKKLNDILHVKLDLIPDFKTAKLNGKATLNIKPYFYETNTLQLNAVGFDIIEVALISGNIKSKLKYNYNNTILTIDLGRTFKRNETYTVYIDYIAQPEKVKELFPEQNDIGLYFINHDKSNLYKPTQLYTQGETQYNSCWFPVIDSPNEKFTQEISITVPKQFKTLSNGLMVWQEINSDSTRTDVWKSNLPNAAYLTMIAAGDYAITKDKYKDKEITYYTETQYENFAKSIFGRTPEMIDFFSRKTGIEYPWEKYAQIVVRDYNGAAMENTSASLFGDFVQKTNRELIDENFDDVIAHELFHQWFGNYVTCESWANLPLNESFATYGEYLWKEYKEGKLVADEHLYNDWNEYIENSSSKEKSLIRFEHAEDDEMFDVVSYQKGSVILHSLRNYVGDEAFFSALNLYLERNKFSNTEVHDLRKVFEEVSGEDLNWFFNQWFLGSGHPTLMVESSYDDEKKKVKLFVRQEMKDIETIFQLPVFVDIYLKGKKIRNSIFITKEQDYFEFDCSGMPDLVNFDAERVLPAEIRYNKSLAEWIYQYNKCSLFADRIEALKYLSNNLDNALVQEVFLKAMNDPSEEIRIYAMKNAENIAKYSGAKLKQQLVKAALKDDKSSVREQAIKSLGDCFLSDEILNVYKRALEDKSYKVVAKTLENIYYFDKEIGVDFCRSFENDSNITLLTTIAQIYSISGKESDNDFYIRNFRRFDGYNKYNFSKMYSSFLMQRNDSIINNGLILLESIARSENLWYIRLAGLNAITDLKSMYEEKQREANNKLVVITRSKPNSAQIPQLQLMINQTEKQISKLNSIIADIKRLEKDPNIKSIFNKN